MEKNQREVWLDFAKILAIFLVIILHTVCYGLGLGEKNIGLVFYYSGTIAIPLFFMINGYLQLKRVVNYQYVIRKIGKILYVALVWNLFLCIVDLIMFKRCDDVFFNILMDFIQKGYFFQFWFLGSLIIIYLILPLLCKIFNSKHESYCLILTALLIVICPFVDIFNINNHLCSKPLIIHTIIQTFRLWTWFMYFCLGGLISKINPLEKLQKKYHLLIMLISIAFFITYQYQLSPKFFGNLYAENFYDSAICILTTTIVFTYIKKIDFKYINLISTLSQLILGVYIIHPTVISIVSHFFATSNNFINLIIALVVFVISLIISYIIYKTPKLNSIIKL